MKWRKTKTLKYQLEHYFYYFFFIINELIHLLKPNCTQIVLFICLYIFFILLFIIIYFHSFYRAFHFFSHFHYYNFSLLSVFVSRSPYPKSFADRLKLRVRLIIIIIFSNEHTCCIVNATIIHYFMRLMSWRWRWWWFDLG